MIILLDSLAHWAIALSIIIMEHSVHVASLPKNLIRSFCGEPELKRHRLYLSSKQVRERKGLIPGLVSNTSLFYVMMFITKFETGQWRSQYRFFKFATTNKMKRDVRTTPNKTSEEFR